MVGEHLAEETPDSPLCVLRVQLRRLSEVKRAVCQPDQAGPLALEFHL